MKKVKAPEPPKDLVIKHKSPITESLPAHLKDPANYEKILKAIYDANVGACASHNDMLEWSACRKCHRARNNRLLMMKSLGFTSAPQYIMWRKIHTQIQERQRLEKYNS